MKDVSLGQKPLLLKSDVVIHDIHTTGKPIKSKYRRIPVGLREKAIQEEERMNKLEVKEPSKSPWAALVVPVRKRDGTLPSLRYVVSEQGIIADPEKVPKN